MYLRRRRQFVSLMTSKASPYARSTRIKEPHMSRAPVCGGTTTRRLFGRTLTTSVLLGIRYCIWRAQRNLRFQNEFVYVHRGRPDLSRLGCRYETDGDDRSRVHEFSFADLYEFCKYDLENAVFVFNSVVCRFKDGIPQGGTRSPADAMAYCIYSEDMFFRSIYDLTYLRKGGLGESGATSLPPPCMMSSVHL
jgi:hypothetical protein